MAFFRVTASVKLGALGKYRRLKGLFNRLRPLCYTRAPPAAPWPGPTRVDLGKGRGVPLLRDESVAEFTARCARALMERGNRSGEVDQSNPGVLAAAGLVAGEGLAGVLVAGLVAVGVVGKSMPVLLSGLPGTLLSTMMLLAVAGLLFRAGRGKTA
jgi:hypothetical protein